MAKRIDEPCWQTKDGRLFATREAANEHEVGLILDEILRKANTVSKGVELLLADKRLVIMQVNSESPK